MTLETFVMMWLVSIGMYIIWDFVKGNDDV
jgi:hypothetical protein